MAISFTDFLIIRESFEPKDEEEYDITWEPSLDEKNAGKNYTARFLVDGDAYVVGFNKLKKKNVLDYYLVWDLDRSKQGWWWTIKSIFNGQGVPLARTNKLETKGIKYTMKVIRGVFKCIHDFVKEKEPHIIEYEAADQDLKKFYNMVSVKLAPKFGYAAYQNMLVKQDSLKRPAVKSIITKPL